MRVNDIARVELGSESYDSESLMNGRPSSFLVIYQQPDANAMEVAKSVKAAMEKLSNRFPEGISHAIKFDTTEFIDASITEVVDTLFGTLLVPMFYFLLQTLREHFSPDKAKS